MLCIFYHNLKKNMVVKLVFMEAPHYNSWHIVDLQQIVAVQHRILYVASSKNKTQTALHNKGIHEIGSREVRLWLWGCH